MKTTRYRGFVPVHKAFQRSMCSTLVSLTTVNPDRKMIACEIELFLKPLAEKKEPMTTESLLQTSIGQNQYREISDATKSALAIQLVYYLSNNPSYKFTPAGWARI